MTLNVARCLSISKITDFVHKTICRVYREWSKKRKHPLSTSSLVENALLIPSDRKTSLRYVEEHV